MVSGITDRAEFIAVDWGTTNRRAYLLGGDGDVLAVKQDACGILNLDASDFPDAFAEFISDWRQGTAPQVPVLMSGMIGSRQGWIEAPYVACPAGPERLARELTPVPGVPDVWIVPGMSMDGGGRRDVMRGEEVQIFGALSDTGRDSARLCLPGTHSKWADVEHGSLTDFATAMTGEVFQVMRDHSILGAMMTTDAAHDADAFAAGIAASGGPDGLLTQLFSVRTKGLFDVFDGDQQPSYLSGLLIGHEIRSLCGSHEAQNDPVLVVGGDLLADLYTSALSHLDIEARKIDAQTATVRGHAALHKAHFE